MKPSHLALALVFTAAACMPPLAPPPDLQVTSPERGLIQQNGEASVVVTGRALPGPDGSPIYKVIVNDQQATVGADGSFRVTVPTPSGALLLKTVALSMDGGKAVDARAVQVGEIRQAGGMIPGAISVALSADAFALISKAASDSINTLDLAPLVPPISYGGGTANLKMTVSQLTLGDVTINLIPTNGGLQIAVQIDSLTAKARAAYAGTLVPDGSTDITVAAQQISFTGTLVVTPTATGFTTSLSAPNISSTGLDVNASGLAGTILDLLMDNLSGTIASIAKSSIGGVIDPALNKALGGLKAPRSLSVLGYDLTVAASANQFQFSSAGALASLNLSTGIALEQMPNYVFTQNSEVPLDLGYGVQLAVADDLVNNMLAQIHATGLLAQSFEKNFEIFDKASIDIQMPPMLSASTEDGSVRLVLGDMILTAMDGDQVVVRAAVNAAVDVSVDRGTTDSEIAIRLGQADVVVNLLDDPENPSQITAEELTGASGAGIDVQVKNMDAFLVNAPVPSFAGVTASNFELHGDGGYVVLGAQLRGTGTAGH
jgi:hypothetical protein